MYGKMEDEEGFWHTNDLVVAATLSCMGYSPVRLQYNVDGNSTHFVYEETPGLLSIVAQYALNRCRVDPKRFNEAFVGLKDEMFTFMRDEGILPRTRAR